MASFDKPFPYILSADLFWRLRGGLHHVHRFSGNGTSPPAVLTESSLGADYSLLGYIDYFSLAISDACGALLVARRVGDNPAACDSPDALNAEGFRQYAVDLITDNAVIEQFIDWLTQFSLADEIFQDLQRMRQVVASKQGAVNCGLVQLLLKTLSGSSEADGTASAVFSPLENTMPSDHHPESWVSWVMQEPPQGMLNSSNYAGGHGSDAASEGDREQMRSAHRPSSAGQLDLNRDLDAEGIRPDQNRVENAKNVFLATVNHELRTPLTYILGMSTTLLRWIDDGAAAALDRQQRHYLESIYNQGKHLLDMINNILDLSQSELGQIALNVQQVSLVRLVQRCIRMYQSDADCRGIILTLESQLDPPHDSIAADPLRLQQIVTSLLSNALKFTPTGGQVTVRLALNDTEATIEVQDTGIGIAEHHQATIFQKFKQVDGSYHRQYAGIGTGLALVKQLTELHRGHISVESTPDVGTLFTVRLPRISSSALPISGALWPRSVTCSGERVVLVDDQSEAASAAADGIIAAGYQLIWIVEGPQIVERIAKLRPHCVVVGTCLTSIDSRELMYRLRQNESCEHLRLIAIDDGRKAAEIEARHQYQNLGVAKVCATPIDLTALLDSLSND